MSAKLPPHCYWRKDTIWGRVVIAGREYRRSLRTADPREAARRVKAWQTKLERQQFGDIEAPGFTHQSVIKTTFLLYVTISGAIARE
jgi:hypothetical protein